MVRRARLVERLNAGSRLTLVSAPAGFGKTTLVSAWIADCMRPPKSVRAAWISLDEGDSDPNRFLTYLVAALQTAAAGIGAGVLAALQSPQALPIEQLLTSLLNEIAVLPGSLILVLDDYHEIDSLEVSGMLTFLIEHLPPQLHLVIVTREDPQLPVARLRARGQLTELRATDLRFTPAEAAEFLNQGMGLKLAEQDIETLEARTEGWIAGLQLAALSMQGRTDAARFIQSFTGSHRFVLDYLVEEVLQRQPEPVRSFLLNTSILDRFNAELCAAVNGARPAGGDQLLLEQLERGSLFVVPLDDRCEWYRYHHLFAEVLRARLQKEQPGQVQNLHRRASVWYEQNSFPNDAIHHALAGADFERAARLIELAWSAMDSSYQSAAWLGWVKALPEGGIRIRPGLCVGYAWALLDTGEMEASEAWLQEAERCLVSSPSQGIVADEELFRSLPATIAAARAFRAQALGDISGTVQFARRALELAGEEDLMRHIQATALLGMAEYARGDLEAASRSLTESMAYMRKAGDLSGPLGIYFVLAEMKFLTGQLNEAANLYQQSLRLLAGQGEPLPVGTSELYRGLGELSIEWNDLDAADRYLQTSQMLGDQAGLPNYQHRLNIAEAMLKEALGDLDGAIERLDAAERSYIRSALPEARTASALKARFWIRQGRLAEAHGWARAQGLSVTDDLTFMREYEHITLARLFVARCAVEHDGDTGFEAVQFLERLEHSAEQGRRSGSLIEILVLQAIAYQAQNDVQSALDRLERALLLAGPEGYCRIFISEGPPLAALLAQLKARDLKPQIRAYVDTLLLAFSARNGNQPFTQAKPGFASHSAVNEMPLVEPLTRREQEILRLLRTDLSGPDMARELMVSLNTLRTHTKNIFNKLGVGDRRAAVRRAEELGLF